MSIGQEKADQRPVGGLLMDLASQIDALVRTEFSLLRAELDANVKEFKGGLVAMLIGAALLVAGLVALTQAAIAAMASTGMDVWLAASIVGVAAGAVGAIVLMTGSNKMSASEASPSRTVRQVEKDAAFIKETVR